MCTIMFYRETRPAEKRSRQDSQEAVDRLMDYDRRLSEPFTREELKEIFAGNEWKFGNLQDICGLLSEDEQRIVAELGLVPESQSGKELRLSRVPDGQTQEDARRQLKAKLLGSPVFDGHSFGRFSSLFGGGGNIYVWLDNCCFGNSTKKGFYYVRYQLSMLAWGSTAYAHPALIVQKNKLRPDQVEYMERKCGETLDAARRERERRNN